MSPENEFVTAMTAVILVRAEVGKTVEYLR